MEETIDALEMIKMMKSTGWDLDEEDSIDITNEKIYVLKRPVSIGRRGILHHTKGLSEHALEFKESLTVVADKNGKIKMSKDIVPYIFTIEDIVRQATKMAEKKLRQKYSEQQDFVPINVDELLNELVTYGWAIELEHKNNKYGLFHLKKEFTSDEDIIGIEAIIYFGDGYINVDKTMVVEELDFSVVVGALSRAKDIDSILDFLETSEEEITHNLEKIRKDFPPKF